MPTRVKELRMEAGLTQQQLAEKAGVSRETIISLERSGTVMSTTATLLKIASALGVTVSKLFDFSVESV